MSESRTPLRTLGCTYVAASGSLLLNFPLDTVKTRMQATEHGTILQSIRSLYREAGFRGFYRGVSASLLSFSAARAVNMSLYAAFIPKYAELFNIPMQSISDRPIVPVVFAGLTAGVFSCILTGPFEFTKTASQVESLIRQQSTDPARSLATSALNNGVNRCESLTANAKTSLRAVPGAASASSGAVGASVGSASPMPQIGAFQTVQNIWRQGGLFKLYGGVEYQCIRDSLGSAVYFAVYEVFKSGLNQNRGQNEPPSPVAVAVAGAMCGMASWLAVYPIDTMKSTYQRDLYSRTLNPSSMHLSSVQRPKFRFSLRMYRGLGFSMMRTSLNGILMFSFLEYLLWATARPSQQ